MGTVYVELTLKNEWDVGQAANGFIKEDEIRTITVTAIVDTGSYSLMIDEQTAKKLGLGITGEQRI